MIESKTKIYNLVKEIIRDNNQKLNSLNIKIKGDYNEK